MTYKEFFRQAALKIFGNLKIEESIFLTLQFLEKRMHVSRMIPEYFGLTLSSARTTAKTAAEGAIQVDLLTPLSPGPEKWTSGYPEDFKTQTCLDQDQLQTPGCSHCRFQCKYT